jgi:hypothetical protein
MAYKDIEVFSRQVLGVPISKLVVARSFPTIGDAASAPQNMWVNAGAACLR